MKHPHATRPGRSAAEGSASSVRGSLGLVCLLVATLLAVSYPVFALGVALGALGTVTLSRVVAAVDARRRSRTGSRATRRTQRRRSRPE
ncbi:hypothetical protein [Haloarcula halophila]|uniref:hypothetical protein n=1 Tax=Haloarcula TaxID=2237 RepID=UPI0023E46FC1|nr:hypothetical protein [Halomicroarcula sp. DFY41]